MKFNIFYENGKLFQGGVTAHSEEEAIKTASSWRQPSGGALIARRLPGQETQRPPRPRGGPSIIQSVDVRNAREVYNRVYSNTRSIRLAERWSGLRLIKQVEFRARERMAFDNEK